MSVHVSASLSTQLPWKAGAGDDKDRQGVADRRLVQQGVRGDETNQFEDIVAGI